MSVQVKKINGLKLRLATWGKPVHPPILFLHGWLDTGFSFDPLARLLASNHYCVAPDLRGYGKSEHTKNPLGYFFMEYVADVHDLVELLFPHKKIDLIGHSLGGAVGAVYAGCFPQKVRSFVNLEGFVYRERPASQIPERILSWLADRGEKKFRHFKTREQFAQRLRKANPRLPEPLAGFLTPHLTKKTGQGFIMAADPKHKLLEPYWLPLELLQEFWKKIECPCLLVAADQSEMKARYPRGEFLKVVKKNAGFFSKQTQVMVLKKCGHMMHQERPEELAKHITNFYST